MGLGVNKVGQLGIGSTASSAVPVEITGVSRVTAIAAGWDSSVAVVLNGASVWAWGGNKDGGSATARWPITPPRCG